MQALQFLIDTLFNLYLMVVILRLWLQLARADFYNPFSQFVVKATNPLVLPLRKMIPSIGSLDTATLLIAYAVALTKILLLQGVLAGQMLLPQSLFWAVLVLVKEVLSLMFWILVIRALLSWVSQGRSPIEYVMQQLTEPLLRPIRRIIPPMGGLDLSVFVALVALQFFSILLSGWFRGF